MRLFAKLLVTVELVGGWQFPPAQLSRQPQDHHPLKELSRRGRSLQQELFLSQEARDNQEDEETNRLSTRMFEHSWQPEVYLNSICSSQFVPNICACSTGELVKKPNSDHYLCCQWRFPAPVHPTSDVLHFI